jgi:hypothetical protein
MPEQVVDVLATRRPNDSRRWRRTRSPCPSSRVESAFEIGLLLDQFDLLERQIETAESRVAELFDGEISRRLQTIPGVGPAIAATLIAEIGDIRRFDDFDELLAFAGSTRSSVLCRPSIIVVLDAYQMDGHKLPGTWPGSPLGGPDSD